MSENELNHIDKLIAEMNAKKDVADSIMEEVEAIKAALRDKMAAAKLDRLNTPNHSISYTECERTSVDKQKLQNEFPALFGVVAKVSKYMVLRIN